MFYKHLFSSSFIMPALRYTEGTLPVSTLYLNLRRRYLQEMVTASEFLARGHGATFLTTAVQ